MENNEHLAPGLEPSEDQSQEKRLDPAGQKAEKADTPKPAASAKPKAAKKIKATPGTQAPDERIAKEVSAEAKPEGAKKPAIKKQEDSPSGDDSGKLSKVGEPKGKGSRKKIKETGSLQEKVAVAVGVAGKEDVQEEDDAAIRKKPKKEKELVTVEAKDENQENMKESEAETVTEEEKEMARETETETKAEKTPSEKKEEGEDEEEDDEGGEGEAEHFDRFVRMARPELVEFLESLVKEEDVNQIRVHIGYIKAAYRKILKEEKEADYEVRLQKEADQDDAADEIVDELNARFEQALEVYKEKKNVYDQAIEQQKQENLILKEKILEELRNLIESEEELKKTYDQFRDLQEHWRNIGAVPQGSKSTLWNNYHFLVEKFFDKVKINKELKDLDLKKNLEAKTELCEKAEELLLETSITRSFQQLQKLHEAWKETGPVPKDKKDEIWDRFKSATEKLNKRRQDYYDNLRDEQNHNYAAKLILCEKAEQLAAVTPQTPKHWQNLTEQINELFKMWKTIGFAPKKVNNEVWNRFRSSLDSFYRNKKEYFKKYKEHQTENYNQKLNLCLQAEALKDNDDWRTTTEELIALQREWKKIGPVPTKFSDKIWKRFRAACDAFFSKKAEHFSNIGEKQEENLKNKQALIERIRKHPYTEDNNANLKILKDFQREWMEIGHVPIKQKEKIQNEFRRAIDEQFDKLNISKKAKSTLTFRSKIDNIKSAPNAENLIYKERNFIINKINTIQSDIKIWENNIGFFASSKKADILKAEFEEKIEKGRIEITILEEKLKILRES